MRLSYSKLNTFRQCPLRYRFTYVDRLPRRPRRLFKAARRIHHALMHWLTYSRAGTPRWEDVRAAYDAAWGALQDPGVRDSADYAEGLQILQDYHAANLERPCQPVFLEHKFTVPVGQHVLIGRIDRVDATGDGYEVIDYKLDRELRPQAAVDDDLQLSLYHLAMQEGQGVRPEALTLYFLRHNIQRTTTRTAAQTAELGKWVAATGNDIATERRWTPCPGEYCGGCDFKSTCPAWTDTPMPPPTPRLTRVDAQMPLLLPGLDAPLSLQEEASEAAAPPQLSLPMM